MMMQVRSKARNCALKTRGAAATIRERLRSSSGCALAGETLAQRSLCIYIYIYQMHDMVQLND